MMQVVCGVCPGGGLLFLRGVCPYMCAARPGGSREDLEMNS